MAKANNTSYYVYLHRKKSNGQVFYVGKGHGGRAKSQHGRNKYWKRVVAKHGYTVEIYIDGLQEWYAFELEKELIAYYGRENLTNGTDGGEGTGGFYPNSDTRLKLSLAKRGVKNHQYGKKHTDETKKKISESKKGVPSNIDDETKKRTLTKLHSAESRKKSSDSRKGVKHSETHRINLAKSIFEKIAKKVKRSDGVIFESLCSATKSVGMIDPSNISKCCRGKQKTAYGYGWVFVK